MLDNYYAKQVFLPHFSSYNRQRGNRFGALAAKFGWLASPFARKFLIHAAKSMGKNCLHKACLKFWMLSHEEKLPGKLPKKSYQKQWRNRLVEEANGLGGPKNAKPQPNQNASREVGRIFFQQSEMLPNVLRLEASHSSLDIPERSTVLTVFDFCAQKFGPILSL